MFRKKTRKQSTDVMHYSFQEYAGMILMLLTSGGVLYREIVASMTLVVFFGISVCLFYYYGEKKNFVSYPIWIGMLSVISVLIVNPNVITNRGLGMAVGAFASFLFFSSFDFYRFRYLYLKILTIIGVLSAIVFVLSELNVLPRSTILITGQRYIFFMCFNLGGRGLSHRMASIWHEPGACMIPFNMALLLYVPDMIKGTVSKTERKMLVVMLVCVLLAQSATGFFVLIGISTYVVFRRKSANIFNKLIFALVGVVFSFFLLTSDLVKYKFEDNGKGSTVSYELRKKDYDICKEILWEHPVYGVGFDTKEYMSYFSMWGGTASSNGFFYMLAALGIPFLILYVFYLLKYTRRWAIVPWDVIVIVILFTILQMNEGWLEFPMSYIFLAPFKSYMEKYHYALNNYDKKETN